MGQSYGKHKIQDEMRERGNEGGRGYRCKNPTAVSKQRQLVLTVALG